MIPTKALYLIMKEAIPNSIETYEKNYETRLIIQKFIYLFDQIWGEDLYNHSWYLAGPYSSTLTHQIYDNLLGSLQEKQKEWNTLNLSDDAKSTIELVKDLIVKAQNTVGFKFSESSSYELVASIWYIAKMSKNEEEIRKELLLSKPYFEKVDNLKSVIQLVTDAMSRSKQ